MNQGKQAACCECGEPLTGDDLEVFDETNGRIDIHLACTGMIPIGVVNITPKDVPIFTHIVTEKDGTERPETPEEAAKREAEHVEIRKKLFGQPTPLDPSFSGQIPDQSSTPPP